MILPILALVVALAMAFTVLAFLQREWLSKIICAMISTIIWISSSVASVTIDIPYTAYNASDNTVVTGVHRFSAAEPGLSWLFLGIGVLVMLYGWYILTQRGIKK